MSRSDLDNLPSANRKETQVASSHTWSGDGNNRYSGGSAGSEHKYHFPAVDTARWQDANYGADSSTGMYAATEPRYPAAFISTTSGPRSALEGASLPSGAGPNGYARGGFTGPSTGGAARIPNTTSDSRSPGKTLPDGGVNYARGGFTSA